MILKEHRFSGWPGAYCLDCGSADPREEALAHGCDNIICTACSKEFPMGYEPCLEGIEKVQDPCCPDPELGEFEGWYYPHKTNFTDCGQHGSMECEAING